ncbi:MAG: DUF3329 domain-containing protein, partial [Gammaproteobacteria bacterium]|nr:DUF3329 domain-containing protein [Gammaproteobacteria bacterium]
MWGRPFSTVILIGVLAFLAWPIFGARGALMFLCASLLLLLLHHLRNLSELYAWLQKPQAETVPAGSGAWEYIYSPLLRMLRRHRQSEIELNQA